jgi:drug/metabolite transporter (DMT)-like permease
MISKKYPGHLAIFFTSVFFGLNVVISKDLLNGAISPVGLNALRFLSGAAAFWLLGLLKPEKVTVKDLFLLFGAAIFGLMINQITFVQGLARTSSIDAAIICTTLPMFTMVFSALILKEPISWLKVIGILVGALGALYLIVSSIHGNDKESSFSGNLLVFASTVSYSFFLVIAKPVSQRYSPVTMMKWMFLFAVVLIVPFSFGALSAVNFEAMDSRNAFSLGFVLVFATVIPYLLIPVAQKRLRPTTQSMYNYVLPIVATALAVYEGNNALTVPKVFATGLVFLGVYIVTRSKSRADVETALK